MAIRCMRIACRVTKAIDTHPEYVMLIAFALQQKLEERWSMLSYTYIGCLVKIWIGTDCGGTARREVFRLTVGASG